MQTSLVIMAAGMGSRYGGLKQVEPVGIHGECIADFSVFDARRAGFNKIVFIIKKEMEDIFRTNVFDNIAREIDAEYVFQEISDIPSGFTSPDSRVKPWGTGHAVLCCRGSVKGNFAVINADDFYGRGTFSQLYRHLTGPENNPGTVNHCMVGFELCNTVTEHGSVSRAVCLTDKAGRLKEIKEFTKIMKTNEGIICHNEDGTTFRLSPDTTVSMNAWGFTYSIFDHLNERFSSFLREKHHDDKAEFFIPYAVQELIDARKATVTVMPCHEKWYGVTYKEDRKAVTEAIRSLISKGIYPEKLWR